MGTVPSFVRDIVWRPATPDLAGIGTSPLIAAGCVIVGTLDGALLAVDLRTGQARWSFRTHCEPVGRGPRTNEERGIRSSAALSADTLCFGADDGVFYALWASSGAQIWAFVCNAPITSTPTTVRGTVLFISGEGVLYALDVKSGALRWQFETAPPLLAQGSALAIRDDDVCALAEDGCLYAIDLATGRARWKLRFAEAPRRGSSPSIAGDTVYWGTEQGVLHAVDLDRGKPQWRYRIESGMAITSAPTVWAGIIFFGAEDGCLYAIE